MKSNTIKTLFAIVVFVALSLFISNPAFAVPGCYVGAAGVWDGDYEIRTAADRAALSGYTSVTGELLIYGSLLINLEGLECLTHVAGRVIIEYNLALTSLAGLDNLISVGGRLGIHHNYRLTSLAGFDNLESAGGDLYILFNRELCTSVAEALRDQVLNADGTGGDAYIRDNKGC